MNEKTTLGKWTITTTLFPDIPPDTKYLYQVHGSTIVDEQNIRNGLTEADGIVTHKVSHPVAIATADCLPLVIDVGDTAVVLHISRKTLIAGILDNLENHITIANIKGMYLGPNICANHFTFEYEGKEITQFKEKFPHAFTENTTIHLSVPKAVQQYLNKWEITKDKIIEDTRCTYEEKELPSYTSNKDIRLMEELATVVSS